VRFDYLARFDESGNRGAAMKITAKDLKELGIVDEIVAEPEGGAHTDMKARRDSWMKSWTGNCGADESADPGTA